MQVVHVMRILEPASKKKCAVCRKRTGGAGDLCGGCAAQFARIYGPKEEEDVGNKGKDQGRKNKIAGAPRALSHDDGRERTLPELLDCLYEVVAGDEHPSAYGLDDREAADRILRATGDDGLKVLARAEVAWLERVAAQKEREDAAAKEDALEEEFVEAQRARVDEAVAAEASAGVPPAPEGEKKPDRIPGWRATPARVVKAMLDHFKWFDWEAVGVPGVLGAEALLKNAHAELLKKEAAAAKKPPKKVAVGVVCRIRERHREAYDGVLEPEEMFKLTVVSLNGKHARVKTAGGETLVPRTEHLEVDPDAAQPGVVS